MKYLFLLVFLVSCAGSKGSYKPTLVKCEYEAPTGSNIVRPVCYREDDAKTLRESWHLELLKPKLYRIIPKDLSKGSK